MKYRSILAVLGLALLAPSALLAQAPDPGIIPGDILVMITPDGDPHTIANDLRYVDNVFTNMRVDHLASEPMRVWLLKFDPGTVSQERMLHAVKAHPDAMIAQNDHPVTFRIIPNDPQYGQQWHHPNIQSPQAWDVTTGGVTANGDTIVVCVIEGANTLHTDLTANRWLNHGEIPNNGIDDDGNGYVDDYRGWNPGGNNDNVYNGGHGTQVAGMIGAKGNNGVGVVGANWDVKIMVVTIGGLSQANVINSYTYPLVMRRKYNDTNGQEGAFVVATNASWGIDGANPNNYPLWCAMYDTLGTEGILNCGATANNNVNVDVVGDMPTACPGPFMISVTATNNQNNRTFSAYGATTIDVGAPGQNVYTTNGSSGYGSTSGTSFASPLTAGVIGLLYSAPCPSLMALVQSDPQAGAMYIRQVLFEGVDQVGNLPGTIVTGGRINANNSMQLIMTACSGCPPPLNTQVSQVSPGVADFSWTSPADGPFSVRYRQVGTMDWTLVTGVDALTYQASGLDPCVAYEFQVEANCDEEDSGFSSSAVLEPPVETAPGININGATLICFGESVILTSSIASNIQWSNGATTPTINVTESGTYTVTLNGQCASPTSSAVTVEVIGEDGPVAPNVELPGPGVATLNATGDSVLWYGSPGGGTPVGYGSPWNTPFLDEPTTFWVGNLIQYIPEVQFGAKENLSNPGQYHTNASFWQLFSATEPFIIRSVKVYANGAGSRPIGLIHHPSNTVLQQGNFNIPNGESRVELDFMVPGPGEYGLRVMSGNPQLWRDGTGSGQSYPYPLGDVGSMFSSSATGTNATALYYFFYDWEVQRPSLTCESDLTPVNVDFPVGLEDQYDEHGVRMFPNPADRDIFFDITGPMANERLLIVLLDNTGREVGRKNTNGGRATLTTAFLADGLYIYRVLHGAQEVARGKFVVNHL